MGILFTGSKAPIQPALLEEESSSFWSDDDDEMRLLAAYPVDAATDARFFCGIGYERGILGMGVDGPVVSLNTTGEKEQYYADTVGGWCPLVYNANSNNSSSSKLTRAMLEEEYEKEFGGRELYCPKDIQSYEAYFKHALKGLDQIKTRGYAPEFIAAAKATPGFSWEQGTEGANFTYCNYFYNGTDTNVCPGALPSVYVQGYHQMQCPVAADRFDNVFIPASRNIEDYMPHEDTDIGNEIMLTQWGGLQYSELAPYMAIFYNSEDDGSREQAFRIADMFFNATSIEIPVVHWANAKSARDLVDERPFECAV